MAQREQHMRKLALKGGLLDTSVDRRNTRTLQKVVRRYGWPTPGLVGSSGARNAWLLAQHADLDPTLQRSFLHALKTAQRHAPNPILEESIRLLQDRIAYNLKHPLRRCHRSKPQQSNR